MPVNTAMYSPIGSESTPRRRICGVAWGSHVRRSREAASTCQTKRAPLPTLSRDDRTSAPRDVIIRTGAVGAVGAGATDAGVAEGDARFFTGAGDRAVIVATGAASSWSRFL